MIFITRQLGCYEESEKILTEALSIIEQEKSEKPSMNLGEVLSQLSSTLESLGKYKNSRFVCNLFSIVSVWSSIYQSGFLCNL